MLVALPEPVVSFEVSVKLGLETEDRVEDSDAEVLEISGALRGGSWEGGVSRVSLGPPV